MIMHTLTIQAEVTLILLVISIKLSCKSIVWPVHNNIITWNSE